jgi:aminoglycoside phosphotransferase (APT) family kinase protein
MIHGDFHPGNIWWKAGGAGLRALALLDRSRGPWGEPADDLTALTINYVFFSVRRLGRLRGAYQEALALFFEEYIKRTGDDDVLRVVAPFYAFRGAVVANPAFYPDVGEAGRRLIFRFVHNVLDADRFDPGRAARYVNARGGSPY